MGYYTTFTLGIQDKEKNTSENINRLHLALIEIDSDNKHVFDNDGTQVWSDGGIKWYEHSEDMEKVSKLLPDLVIQVDGEGEEVGDIWRSFWKNGKVHEAKRTVIVEEFDETKLK